MKKFKDDFTKFYQGIFAVTDMVISKQNQNNPEPVKNLTEKIFETIEICEILNVTKQTVRLWIDNGHLIANQRVKGGKLYINKSELVKFLNSVNGKKYLKIWNVKNQPD